MARAPGNPVTLTAGDAVMLVGGAAGGGVCTGVAAGVRKPWSEVVLPCVDAAAVLAANGRTKADFARDTADRGVCPTP